ncbi:MAG: ArnT family glycosyltransferase, partial [Saprospiraceae bacterium]
MKEQINKFGKYLFWLIPIFGIVLRLVVYFQNRSVFLDEANVCLNIIEKTYPDFFFPLDYDQMVPPLWSIVVKTFQIILGNSEFSFRLFPLICSIFSIYLFWEISNKILQHKISILFINWIFATNIFLLKYATEAKQYGSDVTVTLLLILFALHEKDFNSNSSFFKWLCIGSISIWFSMPSVFILFGVGSYFLFQYSKKKKRIVFPKTLYASFVWILLFGIYYYTLLRHNIQNDYLQNYHQNYFLPIIPSSLS